MSVRSKFGTILLALTASLLMVSCKPDTGVFGGTITGTVLDLTAQPVGLVTVYIVSDIDGRKAEQTDALSGANGRFRLVAPAGTWTLVATDFQGTAAFVYDVHIGNGDVLDVGPVYLQPCAAPGSGTNSDVYEECPDPESSDELGYNAPEGPLHIDRFQPSFTDATLSVDPSGDILEVSSYDDAQAIRIDVQIPESSPYFTEGTHAIPDYAGDFFATLYDLERGVIYLFRSGTFVLEDLSPEEGGTFRARFTDAIFEWYDYQNQSADGSYEAIVAETDPAMTDSISINEVVTPGGGSGPPPQSYHVGTLVPEYTQVYVAGDGSLQVAMYDVFDTGEYVQIFLDVPPALNTSGAHAVQNTFGSSQSSWTIELNAHASYTDAMGYEYLFMLASATWAVADPVTGVGDSLAASLEGATFYWQDHPASSPYSTLTLTMQSSGLMQGAADPAEPDDGGTGRLDWLSLRDGFAVQLGN